MKNNNIQQNLDEAQRLLHKLEYTNSLPDGDFKKQLKMRVLGEVNNSFKFRNIMKFITLKKAALTFAFAVLVVLGATVGMTRYNLHRENQKFAFLAKVYAQNPQISLSTDSISTAKEKKLYPNEYKFQDTEITYTKGAKYESCEGLISGNRRSKVKYLSYTSFDENIFSNKNIRYNWDGKIAQYSLEDGLNMYEYMGGKYAVKTPIPQMEGEPVAEIGFEEDGPTFEEMSEREKIELLYGKEIEISEYSSDYYQIKGKHFIKCDMENGTDEHTYYSVEVVRKDNLVTERTELYLDEVKSENLIYTSEYKITNSNEPYEKFKDLFVFDLDVEVRNGNEIKINQQQVMAEALLEELEKDPNIIGPKSGYKFVFAHVSQIFGSYKMDPDFNNGNEPEIPTLFVSEKDGFLFSMQFIKGEDVINMDVYSKDANIPTSDPYSDNIVTYTDKKIKVNGEEIDAKLKKTSTRYLESVIVKDGKDTVYKCPENEICRFDTYYLQFSYGNYQYNLYKMTKDAVSIIPDDEFTTDFSDRSKLEAKLEEPIGN